MDIADLERRLLAGEALAAFAAESQGRSLMIHREDDQSLNLGLSEGGGVSTDHPILIVNKPG